MRQSAVVTRRSTQAWMAAIVLGLCLPPAGHGEPPAPDFDHTIAPLLIERCLTCHSGPQPKGRLDLSRHQAVLAGGRHTDVLRPGQPDQSRLWKYVASDRMPPRRPLPATEKAQLHAWITAGARWGTDPIDPFRITTAKRAGYDWWALQPVRKPAVPSVRDSGWPRNAIDHFVLHRLEARGLHPAVAADRRTLIRRLSFDLLGLPPSPAEVAAFVRDPSPDAYERLVERYLASPQYGVRWARHWLDVVRFGESNGFEFNEFRPHAWRYRDWVVHALNCDMPYGEFVRLQLAGDVLRPGDADAITATGFLVAGCYDTVGQTQQSVAMKRVVRQDELEDIVGTVGQTFLGLTVNCARCHDHKFDPIRQVDYYRLTAALGGVHQGDRLILLANSHGVRQQLALLAVQVAALMQGIPTNGQLWQQEGRLAAAARKVYAVTPQPPGVAHRLIRGNAAQPAEVVSAGGVAALRELAGEFGVPADAPDAVRRQRLAAWVTDPLNPLFRRVIVNRLWHYHFGVGMVDTPNDFGFNGGRPSHPHLLDWLAAELAEHHDSLKHIHRLMVLSATYRQGSRYNPTAARIDAGNRLLWRKSPDRLEAETLRDAVLSVAGQLDLRLDGPSFQDFQMTQAKGTAAMFYKPLERDNPEFHRRSLYRATVRGGGSRLLDAFDCPDPSATSPRRAVTTTPLQALALLNNALVLRMADVFARRLEHEAGSDVDRQIERAYWLAYGRAPDAAERRLASQIVRQYGLFVLTRALFNSNEFLYVD